MRGSGRRNGSWALAHLSLPIQDLEDMSTLQCPLIPPMTEYFFDGTSDLAIFPPPVSIEPTEVDFGACPGPKNPNPVPLYLMNHTKGKITVVWTHRSDCPFWVTPDTCDVPPLKSMAMRLHFHPPYPNCLYAVELEAFAVYKVCPSRRDQGWGCLSVLKLEWQGGVEGVGWGCSGIHPLRAKLLRGHRMVFTGLSSPKLKGCLAKGLPGPSDYASFICGLPLRRTQLGSSPLGKFST